MNEIESVATAQIRFWQSVRLSEIIFRIVWQMMSGRKCWRVEFTATKSIQTPAMKWINVDHLHLVERSNFI